MGEDYQQLGTPCPHSCCGHRKVTTVEGHSHREPVESCRECWARQNAKGPAPTEAETGP